MEKVDGVCMGVCMKKIGRCGCLYSPKNDATGSSETSLNRIKTIFRIQLQMLKPFQNENKDSILNDSHHI